MPRQSTERLPDSGQPALIDALAQVRFAVERFPAIADELAPLFLEHWREVALDKDRIALAPNWPEYWKLDAAGLLICHTLRVEGELAGYFLSVVVPALHYRGSLQAFQDIYYLKREYRRGDLAYRFFKWTDRELKARGVQKRHVMRKCHLDPRIGSLWRRLGYRMDEIWYSRILED